MPNDPSPKAFWEASIANNPLWNWALALGLALGIFFLVLLIISIATRRLRRVAERTPTKLDDLILTMLGDLRAWCVLVVAVYVASRFLLLPLQVHQTLRVVLVAAIGLQLLITSRLVVDFVIGGLVNRNRTPDGQPDPSLASASGILRFLAMLVLASLLLLLALTNLGIEITPLITGLGIGGIAVALAAQSILGDLFGSLSILFDKPFLIGDFIVVGEHKGTVEKIGVKTTRVRALTGEQLIFSNRDLLDSRIQNFKRMEERRIVGVVNVVYETPAEKLEALPALIRGIVESQPLTRFDRAHFKALSTYSLDFEYVYFVKSPEYNVFMDTQQAINLALFRAFQREGLEFAYPTAVEIFRPGAEPGSTPPNRPAPQR